jgi:hypothetical protein
MRLAARTLAAVAVAASIAGVLLGRSAHGAEVRRQPSRAPAAAARHRRAAVCPAQAAAIPARGYRRAAGRAAQYFMTHVPRSQFPGATARRTDLMDRDSRVWGMVLASKVALWRGAARLLCGSEMVDRTLVVSLLFPHVIGSGKLGILFVMRERGGAYRVWYMWHP